MSKLLTLISIVVLTTAPLMPAPGQEATKAQPAELILHNGYIWTVDSRNSVARAVAIRDGKFVLVGSNEAALSLRGPQTKVIDRRLHNCEWTDCLRKEVIPAWCSTAIVVTKPNLHTSSPAYSL